MAPLRATYLRARNRRSPGILAKFAFMDLVEITNPPFDVAYDIVYATDRNFTGVPIYRRAACYLHKDAAAALSRAIELAAQQGFRFKIFDAFRPTEAQWVLWNHTPNPDFLADPRRGSPHSRGTAVDLTLIDGDQREVPMGTEFDAFTPLAHHANIEIQVDAQRNRSLLLGLMTAAGWDFYRKEWWHYQLFDSRQYALIDDGELPQPMMG